MVPNGKHRCETGLKYSASVRVLNKRMATPAHSYQSPQKIQILICRVAARPPEWARTQPGGSRLRKTTRGPLVVKSGYVFNEIP